MQRHRIGWILGGLLAWAFGPVLAAATLESVRNAPLPEEIATAIDLRLDASGQPLLAVAHQGSVLLPWPPSKDAPVPVSTADSSVRFVAASEQYQVAASVLRRVSWQGLHPTASAGSLGLEAIEAVDIHGDRLALFGLQRHENGMAQDGAIAWTVRLGVEPFSVKPIAYSEAGPGAEPLFHCILFGLGGVRFLPDGRLVLVPGAEPGIFLFDTEQKLSRTWDTDAFDIGADCSFGEQQAAVFRTNEEARSSYLNRFRVIDDILPFDFGPGLIVRVPGEDGPRWELLFLEASGDGTLVLPLPIQAGSDFARLRGDVRGRNLMILYSEVVPGLGFTGARIVELRLEGEVFGSKEPIAATPAAQRQR